MGEAGNWENGIQLSSYPAIQRAGRFVLLSQRRRTWFRIGEVPGNNLLATRSFAGAQVRSGPVDPARATISGASPAIWTFLRRRRIYAVYPPRREATMSKSSVAGLLVLLSAFALAPQVTAQDPSILYGRVQDAVSEQPVADARVLATDSSAMVFTDSLGTFAIEAGPGARPTVIIDKLGYMTGEFSLAGTDGQFYVIPLEPAPFVLEGVEAVSQSSVTRMVLDLQRRRNSYQGAVRVLDRTRMEGYTDGTTAWDLIRQRVPTLLECDSRSGLCMRGRARTIRNPFPIVPVFVCVDQWQSFGAIAELDRLSQLDIAMIEIYSRGRGGIRVYTTEYLAHAARTGRFIATPLGFGC